MVELRQLRYFAAIAETGSFTRAAERLHVSQPPLSTQIKRLEDEIGAPLLLRGNRGVTLTEAGRVFHEHVVAALARLDQAREMAVRVHRGAAGRLTIGFVSIADYGILPPALKHFRLAYPEVEVQLHELTTDAQIRELRERRLDLGLALAPVDDPDLLFTPLTCEALVLAAPAGHPALAGRGAVDLRRLSSEPFIVVPRNLAPGLHDLVIARCRDAGFTPRITQHARQMQTVISLVSSGMGVALVPASVRNLRRAGVQYRALAGAPAAVGLGVLRRQESEPALSGNFIAALRSVAGAAPRDDASQG